MARKSVDIYKEGGGRRRELYLLIHILYATLSYGATKNVIKYFERVVSVCYNSSIKLQLVGEMQLN